MVYKFFDEKISGGTVKSKNIFNKELAEELHKPITRKCSGQYLGSRSSKYAIDK